MIVRFVDIGVDVAYHCKLSFYIAIARRVWQQTNSHKSRCENISSEISARRGIATFSDIIAHK